MSSLILPSRRLFLAGASALVAAPAIVRAQTVFQDTPFTLGVASGDPLPDGFVLWTRLAPRPLEMHGGMTMAPKGVPVAWEVAGDDGFKSVIQTGEARAWAELGHSVHVEVAGLQPGRFYWYRFTASGVQSPIGRAKTAPARGVKLDKVSFAAAGCQAYDQGYYTAYRHLSGEDLDFVFHYGDYIYEGAEVHDPKKPRAHLGDEPYSLDDYRRRYALYKMDADLQAAHAAHPFFITFDDHEIENNWAGADDQTNSPRDVFLMRRQSALQAWYEHMPVRKAQMPSGPNVQLYRRMVYGDLLNANFMDTRQFRTDQPCGDGTKPYCAEALDPKGQMINAAEEAWLRDSLHKPQARWNLVAQQVMMMPMDRRKSAGDVEPAKYNLDSWAGYPIARQRIIDLMRGLGNVVVVTGDEHQNFVGELREKGLEGNAVAVEFVATSISSGGDWAEHEDGIEGWMSHNPQLKYESARRGYLVCEVGRDTWTSHIRAVDYVTRPGCPLTTKQSFAIGRGKPEVQVA